MVSCHTAGIRTGEQADLVLLMMCGPHPCRETLVLKSPAAPCMGEDVHGNKYFEDSAQPAGPLLISVCTLMLLTYLHVPACCTASMLMLPGVF